MFKVSELSVKDWCQHRSKTIKFVPGTNGIVGTNGKGKSNLLGALFTAITGRVLVDELKDNINFESDKAVIDMSFTQDGVNGHVRRAFTGTRIEGDAKNRKDVSSTAKLTYGTVETSKASKVTEDLIKITGMSPRVIEDHIFISQDRMQEMLFQRKSDRMRSFLTLIPGVERAEPVRDRLQKELAAYPELMLTSNMEEVKQQLSDNIVEQAKLEAYSKELDSQIRNIDITAILADEAKIREYAQLDTERTRINYLAERAANEESNLLVQCAEADTELAAGLRSVEGQQAAAESARTELSMLDKNKSIYATRKRALDRRDKLMAEVAVIEAPADNGRPWDQIPVLQAQHIEWASKVKEHDKALKLLRLGNDCPTCGKPFENAEEERAKHTAGLKEATFKAGVFLDDVNRLTKMEREYNSAISTYLNWVDSAQTELQSLTATLDSLPEVPEPSSARQTQLTTIINGYNRAKDQIADLERTSRDLHTLLVQTSSRVSSLNDQRTALDIKLANRMTETQIAVVAETHKLYNTYTAELAVTSGKLSAKKDEQLRLEQNVLKIDLLTAKAKSVTEYRTLVNNVREVLHRDRLPNEVLGTYVQELDSLVNKFLELFGNPFAVCLDREMEMECRFPNGYVGNTTRLSGGQKCVLSVAMRFAINELFAKDLGLLVLDEPTQWMDDDNIAYMGDLIDNIQRAGKESGVQTIVITHAKELVPYFEHVIDLN